MIEGVVGTGVLPRVSWGLQAGLAVTHPSGRARAVARAGANFADGVLP